MNHKKGRTNQMKKGLTLLLSLVLVLAMSVTAFAAEDWVTPVQNIEKWDEEVCPEKMTRIQTFAIR